MTSGATYPESSIRPAGLSFAPDERVIETRHRLDTHIRLALESVTPYRDIVVDDLIVTVAAQDENRLAELARETNLVVRREVVVVGGRHAEKELIGRERLCHDEMRGFFGRACSRQAHSIAKLANDGLRHRKSRRREHHDAIRMGARGDLRRESRAEAVPEHKKLVPIHLGLSSQQRDRRDRIIDDFGVDGEVWKCPRCA